MRFSPPKNVLRGDWLAAGPYGGNEVVLQEETNPQMEGMIHLSGNEVRAGRLRPTSITQLSDELGITVRIQGPFMGGERIQEIRLYNQIRRIDFRSELKGFPGHDGMMTVVFPLPRRGNPQTAHETHNAVTLRPDGIYAAHTWVDVGDSKSGTALINRGTGGYEIEGATARLIWLRSITQHGLYQAPEASEAGNPVIEYALYPHSGHWSESAVVEAAHSFNSPLRALATDAHEGTLPEEHSFLSIDLGGFEVTALKKADQGEEFILRGHEMRGTASRVGVQIRLPVERAFWADLLERSEKELEVQDGRIEFDCQPFQFVTLRLQMKSRSAAGAFHH